MTRRLYFSDPYLSEFDAEIVETRDTDDGPAVIFAATYFYPESGGQPDDRGTVGEAAVVRVHEEPDGTILHVLDRLPAAKDVHCTIDAARRHDHMQQHAGQHILSAAFVEVADAQTVSFHLGSRTSTIDLDKNVGDADITRAEVAANEVVRRAAAIGSTLTTHEEALALGLRKPPPEPSFGEALRIVEVEGFDRQACCGTHPSTASEVGPIVVRGSERANKTTRVEFLCGERAVRDYHDTTTRIRQLARILSSPEAELVETAERLTEERKATAKELTKLRSAALAGEVESWMESADELGDHAVLVKNAGALAPPELRTAAQTLAKHARRVILLGSVHDGRAHLVFARSSDVDRDMGAMMRDVAPIVEGKGGGSKELAQGGGPRIDRLDEALDLARRTLDSKER